MTQIILAAQSAQQSAGGLGAILGNPIFMILLMFIILYFFMIRPQNKRRKEIQNFQNSLTEGTQVFTSGGIYGTVKKIDLATGTVEVKIADGVVVKVDKSCVYKDNASSPNQGQ
jgi:preprotein translocase subunit YajC